MKVMGAVRYYFFEKGSVILGVPDSAVFLLGGVVFAMPTPLCGGRACS